MKIETNNLIVRVCGIALTAVTILIILRIWCGNEFDIFHPMSFLGGDETSYMAEVKMMLDEGTWLKSNYLGAPYGTDRSTNLSYYLFNDVHLLSFIWVKIFKNVALAVNLTFFTLIFLNGFSMYFLLRIRKIGVFASCAGSVLYAFEPYVLMRNTGHIMLSATYTIPIAFLICLWIMEDREFLSVKKVCNKYNIIVVLFAFLIANSGIGYYMFFSCLLILTAGLMASFSDKNLNGLWKSVKTILTIFVAFCISISGFWVNILRNKDEISTAVRSMGDIEIYSLKISRLFIPPYATGIQKLDDIFSAYGSVAVCQTETTEFLGLVGIAGILIMMYYFLSDNKDREIQTATKLTIVTLIYGTIGGLCVFVFLFVTNLARCTNRMSVYIFCMSIFCAIKVCENIKRKLCDNKKKIIWIIAVAVILVIGVKSQLKVTSELDNTQAKETSIELKSMIEEIEAKVPDDTAVYQLPNQTYPTGGFVNNMFPNAEFMPYIFSSTLRFSYGATEGEEAYQLNTGISSMKIEDAKQVLLENGYTGILIDVYAYTEEEWKLLLQSMQDEYGEADIVSSSGRWVYYSVE